MECQNERRKGKTIFWPLNNLPTKCGNVAAYANVGKRATLYWNQNRKKLTLILVSDYLTKKAILAPASTLKSSKYTMARAKHRKNTKNWLTHANNKFVRPLLKLCVKLESKRLWQCFVSARTSITAGFWQYNNRTLRYVYINSKI